MAINYAKAEFIEMLENAANDMAVFYRQDFVNYRGKTSDTDEYYTEIIADWCCSHIDLFNQIPKITRKTTYKMSTHDGRFDPNSPREEEIAAMKMFRHCREVGRYDHIGEILDYQTPLKGKQTDTAGKIDLLAYNGACLRLLELKKPNTQETMLRCVLEGFTYLKTVDQAKLLEDFSLPADTQVNACPFVFVGSVPYEEMKENRPVLKHLMKLLNSRPYYIQKNGADFAVTEGER